MLTGSCAHEGGPYASAPTHCRWGMVTGTRFTDALHPDMKGHRTRQIAAGRLSHVDIVEAAAFLISDRSRNITGDAGTIAAGTHMRW